MPFMAALVTLRGSRRCAWGVPVLLLALFVRSCGVWSECFGGRRCGVYTVGVFFMFVVTGGKNGRGSTGGVMRYSQDSEYFKVRRRRGPGLRAFTSEEGPVHAS